MIQRFRLTGVCVAIASATLASAASAQYTLELQVSPPGAGVAASFPNATEIAEGEIVTVTATALDGYEFAGWEGDIVAAESSFAFEMVDHTTLTAVFVESPGEQFKLTAFVDPSGAGTIVRDPADVGYSAGTVVTLSAFANPGFAFTGWSGDLPADADPSSATLNVTVHGDLDLQATFAAASTLADGDDDAGAAGAGCGAVGILPLGLALGLMLSMKLSRSRR